MIFYKSHVSRRVKQGRTVVYIIDSSELLCSSLVRREGVYDWSEGIMT